MFNRFLLIVMVSVTYGVAAQTNFPYSSSGVGERLNSLHPVFSGMGNQSVTYAYPSVLNTSNPATYSYLRHQFPIFSVGFSTRLSFNQADSIKEFNSSANISEIAFGLSFAKRFGLAFGLKPVYKKSYSITEKYLLMEDSIRYDYMGNGTLNKAFIGFSVNILNFESFKWSVGGNVGGLFGTVQDERRSSIETATTKAGGVETRNQHLRSFHYDLGTLIQYRIKNGHTISVGGTYEPQQQIRSSYNRQLSYSASDVSNPNTYQLLTESGELKGKILFASSYTAGFSYSKTLKMTKKDGSERNSQLMVAASYSATDWSKYRENYSDTSFSYNLKNSSGFQVGIQYIPETQYFGNLMPKFFERINYRVGFYSNVLPYIYNGVQLNEWAATAGFGIPVLVDKRLDSSVQLGVGVGKRGNNQPGATNETFVSVNIGILIAPSINDRWFVKRKLD